MRLSSLKALDNSDDLVAALEVIGDPNAKILVYQGVLPDGRRRFHPRTNSGPDLDEIIVDCKSVWGSLLLVVAVLFMILITAYFYEAWESASHARAASRVLLSSLGMTAIVSSAAIVLVAFWARRCQQKIFRCDWKTKRVYLEQRSFLGKLQVASALPAESGLRVHAFEHRIDRGIFRTSSGSLIGAQVGDEFVILATERDEESLSTETRGWPSRIQQLIGDQGASLLGGRGAIDRYRYRPRGWH